MRRAENPWPKVRLRGVRAHGLAYEKAICKALGFKQGIWFNFEDANGPGYCCPDGLGLFGSALVIAEVKLTQTLEAIEQLELLYRPICEAHWPNKAIITMGICKILTKEPWPGPITNRLDQALMLGPIPLLHAPFPESTFPRSQKTGASGVLRSRA